MDVSRIKKRMIEELRATKEIISDTSISDCLLYTSPSPRD